MYVQPLSFMDNVRWSMIINLQEASRGKQDDPLTFCSICVQTPFTLTLRIWDIYIFEGERLLPSMSYTILKLHKSKTVCATQSKPAAVQL